jgi:uncharacterized membrane protein (UPF0127 family)
MKWLVLLSAMACGASSKFPTGSVVVDGKALSVEVADDDALRAQGLMYRTSLPAGSGMVFVYDDEAPRSFWMKDTRIPLSIAFVGSSGRIVSISDMQPLNTTSVPSGAPARYAIEVNKGWFAEHDVAVGDMVEGLKDLPRSSKK